MKPFSWGSRTTWPARQSPARRAFVCFPTRTVDHFAHPGPTGFSFPSMRACGSPPERMQVLPAGCRGAGGGGPDATLRPVLPPLEEEVARWPWRRGVWRSAGSTQRRGSPGQVSEARTRAREGRRSGRDREGEGAKRGGDPHPRAAREPSAPRVSP